MNVSFLLDACVVSSIYALKRISMIFYKEVEKWQVYTGYLIGNRSIRASIPGTWDLIARKDLQRIQMGQTKKKILFQIR